VALVLARGLKLHSALVPTLAGQSRLKARLHGFIEGEAAGEALG
jgi:hypothetical protein